MWNMVVMKNEKSNLRKQVLVLNTNVVDLKLVDLKCIYFSFIVHY